MVIYDYYIKKVNFMNYRVNKINKLGFGTIDINNDVALVPYVLPNEMIEISAPVKKAGKLFALPEVILEPSIGRQKPPCSHFMECGGCILQHMNREFYQKYKTSLAEDAIISSGYQKDFLSEIFYLEQHERRRTKLKSYIEKNELILGYTKYTDNELINIETCSVITKEINQTLNPLKEIIKKFSPSILTKKNPMQIFLTECDNGIDLMLETSFPIGPKEKSLLNLLPNSIIRISVFSNEKMIFSIERTNPIITLGNHQVVLPIGSFLQACFRAQQRIIEFILKYAKNSYKILDLFAGIGTYSIPLAKHSNIYAIEGNKSLLSTMKDFSNIKTEERDLYKNPVKSHLINQFDFAVINPPRNGASPQFIELARSNIEKIILVSCDLKTFTRDIAILKKSNFELIDAVAIDQFLYSPHLEMVAYLERKIK